MNKFLCTGRLTADPKMMQSNKADGSQGKIARFTLAIDREGKAVEGQPTADFPSFVCFNSKRSEFIEAYIKKGLKVEVVGRLQTGSYTNKEGQKVYTTEVVVDEIGFAESKKQDNANSAPAQAQTAPQTAPAQAMPPQAASAQQIPPQQAYYQQYASAPQYQQPMQQVQGQIPVQNVPLYGGFIN